MISAEPLFEALIDGLAAEAIQIVEADPTTSLKSERLKMETVARVTAELCLKNFPITEQGEI